MYVEELQPGTDVEVVIKGTDKLPLHLNTKVTEREIDAKIKHFIFLEPCYHEEALINPNSLTGEVELNYIPVGEDSSRVECWKRINFKYLSDLKCYIVITNNMSKAVNRRQFYRVSIGCPAVVRVGENRKTYDCTVHDISLQGVSITMGELEYDAVGIPMSVVFYEEATGTNFRISCLCVRACPVGRNLWRYGCQFTKTPPELASYVYRKQREEMAKRSGNEPRKPIITFDKNE
jgi:hypothetical protein